MVAELKKTWDLWRRMNLRVLALAAACVVCFAGNSLICKWALGGGLIGAAEFTLVRIVSGAVVLAALARSRGLRGLFLQGSWRSALALFVYAAFFSMAYLRLDAGIGALVLFGFVQGSMLGWSAFKGAVPSTRTWVGLAVAFCGLGFLTVPGKSAPDFSGLLLMATAGIAWGVYSLRGKGVLDPVLATTTNFIRAVPLALVFLGLSLSTGVGLSASGVALAVLSGAATSGLGYALWYSVVPALGPIRAAVVQLVVPPVALALSIGFLGEQLTFRSAVAALLILAGVGVALWVPQTSRRT